MISISESTRTGAHEEALDDEDAFEDLERSLASDRMAWRTCKRRETPRCSTLTTFLKRRKTAKFRMFPMHGRFWVSPRFRTLGRDEEQDPHVEDEHLLGQVQLLPLDDDLQDALERVALGRERSRWGALKEEVVQTALGFINHHLGIFVQRLPLGHRHDPRMGQELSDCGRVDEVVKLVAIPTEKVNRSRTWGNNYG